MQGSIILEKKNNCSSVEIMESKLQRIYLREIADECEVKPAGALVYHKYGEKVKKALFNKNEYSLYGEVTLLDFTDIEAITSSVINELLVKPFYEFVDQGANKFPGTFILTGLENGEVFAAIESELLARLKRKEMTNEFFLYLDSDNHWDIIPNSEEKPLLETKLYNTLRLVMKYKQITSTELVVYLKDEEELTVKNARIRLEKLFNHRLVMKEKSEGKEFIYKALF